MNSDEKEKKPFHGFIDMETVEFLMKKNHIDEKELAKRVGVTPQTVRRWLRGADQTYFSGDLPIKIARALDTTVVTVLAWECKMSVE